jgi:phosphomannomutase
LPKVSEAPHDVVAQALAWRDGDPDPGTRAEIDRLLERAGGVDVRERSAARAELLDRFAGTLQFGTAGLRGEIGAGPNRMNRAVVIRAAAGLAAYLDAAVGERPRVAVGFDARTLSDVFARDTCAVMTAAGCEVLLLPRPLPTPILAFTVRRHDCDAGVMVTASHNPPQDNGYKVYLGGRASEVTGQGAQIVPPADELIEARIQAVPSALAVPMATAGWTVLGESALQDYLDQAVGVLDPDGDRALDIVSTPLHGVGGAVLVRALELGGFPAPYVVPEQAEPDPAFPTVTFPNPEEPGAMDLALAAASERAADLVIANDPDADRCAVASPTIANGHGAAEGSAAGEGPAGSWRMLRGDEVGALLGEYILSRLGRRPGGIPAEVDGHPASVAVSIVSSQLLARVAAAHGVRHVETLTGFKWLARVPGLLFAYEEALGYCVAPGMVRDKDGLTAALLVAELAAELKADGRTLIDALDDLARRHGVHATDQLSVRVDDLEMITGAMARLREHPPATLGGARVVSAEDLATGAGGLPGTDALRYRTRDDVRVVVRPSGTEPKLKCYLEAIVPVIDSAIDSDGSPDGLASARQVAADRLAAVRDDLSAALGL